MGMDGRRLALLALGAACAFGSVSCAGGRNPLSRERVVVEENRPLAEGESLLFPLDSGRYRAEVTSDREPITVEWRGAQCPASGETRSFTGECEMPAYGQILVRNPPDTGSGVPVTVHIRVVKTRP